MEAKKTRINNSKSLFGIEVEFYIVDQNDFPVLNSNEIVKNVCIEFDSSLSIVQELSSFQIEINPGPWELNNSGLNQCINELKYHYSILKNVVSKYGWHLCEYLTPRKITQNIINHSDYYTKGERYQASSSYFSNRKDVVLKNNDVELIFPGESIIGCINEIHIHVQLQSDSKTIELFNYLNKKGVKLVDKFSQPIIFNNVIYNKYNSYTLFELANGEYNSEGTVNRVGNIPFKINSYKEYQKTLNTFNSIPYINKNDYLDIESTVYFWTRLRNKPNNLRVEFRPMEMGINWIERVKYLYETMKSLML